MVLSMDSLKVKSRAFVLVPGSIFFLLTFYLYISNILYSLPKEDTTMIETGNIIMKKNSTQRSIYFQIMIFSMRGIYVLVTDRKMEKIIFAVNHLYRSTGETSEDKRNERYLIAIKRKFTHILK